MPVRPLLLGHRGARVGSSLSENTLAVFDFALAQGCNGFEFDVRLSADQQLVICHDPKFRGLVVERHPARELELPTLLQVLERYRQSAFLDVELKVAGMESAVLDLMRNFIPLRGCVISSFLPEVLIQLKNLASEFSLGLICETQTQLRLWRDLPCDFVIPHFKLIDLRLISEIHGSGKKVLVWTVNSLKDMQKFTGWGVDGIISDNPTRLASLAK
jgi:glycerophosphoryl diester phosphodiesterase